MESPNQHEPVAAKAENRLHSYRCTLREPNEPSGALPDLADFIQLKAPHAERAMQLAHQVTGKAVIDATRIEVPA